MIFVSGLLIFASTSFALCLAANDKEGQQLQVFQHVGSYIHQYLNENSEMGNAIGNFGSHIRGDVETIKSVCDKVFHGQHGYLAADTIDQIKLACYYYHAGPEGPIPADEKEIETGKFLSAVGTKIRTVFQQSSQCEDGLKQAIGGRVYDYALHSATSMCYGVRTGRYTYSPGYMKLLELACYFFEAQAGPS